MTPPLPLDRRRLLRGSLGAALLFGLPRPVRSQQAGPLAAAAGAQRLPLEHTLVSRITQGFSEAALAECKALGYVGYLEQQLDPAALDDTDVDQRLSVFPTLGMTPYELVQNHGLQTGNTTTPTLELLQATFLRAVYSRRQLLERMVEFWTDHFSVYIYDGSVRFLKPVEDHELIRPLALGKFGDLLHAVARSAGMSIYLDNNTNIAAGPNENYARELMELHTLGVDGGYSEEDVQELARCLTGWNYVGYSQPTFGDFQFQAGDHDTGSKEVLGLTIAAGGGVEDAEQVIDLLATHPGTARFVCKKLARWFVSYDPPQWLVDDATATFLATEGDIREVLRTLLAPGRIKRAAPWLDRKLKRPFHHAASLARATGAEVSDALAIFTLIENLGQVPFLWSTPNGYPDAMGAWGANLLPRWKMASDFFDQTISGITLPGAHLDALLAGVPPAAAAGRIDQVLTGGVMTEVDTQAVQAFLDGLGTVGEPELRQAFALAASSPSFQRY